MTAPAAPLAPRKGFAALYGGVAGLAVLAGLGVAAPRAALHGWLVGFGLVGGVPLGALALLLVHRLTGGRWGGASRPVLGPAAAALPLVAVLPLPLLIGAGLVYPWAADPASAGEGVAALYLNPLSVGLRAAAGFAVLSLVARRLLAGRLGRLGAGLGLCAYALFMDLSSLDWFLSLAPRFTSSAFGVQVIVAQILSALCVAVLCGRLPDDDPAWADLAGLMLAATLGESYLVLIGFTIHWYGDLPEQAHWYLSRTAGAWRWLDLAGAVLGAGLPLLALLFGRVRRDPRLLRPVALMVLAGLLVEYLWLVTPAAGPVAVLAGLLAAATLAALVSGAAAMTAPMGGGARGP